MGLAIRSMLAVLALVVGLAAPALAGPFEDGFVAYEGGDYATALRLWRPIAEHGDAMAQFNLGVMYATGRGVEQDYTEAVKQWMLAAEQGLAGAQVVLGGVYYDGQGVPQDYVQAHKWLNLAAAKGNNHAGKIRDLVAKQMTSEQIADAQRLAREWKPK